MPNKHRAASPGSPPGTLNVDPEAGASRIRYMAYDADQLVEKRDVEVEQLGVIHQSQPGDTTLWVDVIGLGSAETLHGIGRTFGLHPLVLEDMLHVRQRPKVEEYDDYNFIVVRMISEVGQSETEQLAIVLKRNCVITVQERPGDCLEPVRQRLRGALGRIRVLGADYLAYAIIDAVVDHYAPHLDWHSDLLQRLEEQVLATTGSVSLGEIYDLKHHLLDLRRVLVPMRDAIGRLHREEIPLFTRTVDPYLRDCYDHSVRLLESLEMCRDSAVSLMSLHLSTMSHRMNEVMKVLTIIATIFIPLSFITGLYGMNFDPGVSRFNMPELSWRLGYPFALGIMGLVAGALLFYFRRKGWLGGSGPGGELMKRRPPRDG